MNRNRARQAGFSLLEVLMALIVASILAATLLGVQRHSMRLTEINLGTWEALNLGQDILLSKNPKELVNPIPSWVDWAPYPGGKLRLGRERMFGSEYVEHFLLETEASGYTISWEWQYLRPLPKLRKANATKSAPKQP